MKPQFAPGTLCKVQVNKGNFHYLWTERAGSTRAEICLENNDLVLVLNEVSYNDCIVLHLLTNFIGGVTCHILSKIC